MKRKIRSRRWPAVVLGMAMLGGVSTALAETVYVTDTANVLSDEGPAATLLATAPQGTAMTVIARNGDWINVQVTLADGSTVTGWVFSSNVQSTRPGGDFFSGLTGGGNATASDVSASAASKGLNPEAADWAKNNNLDPTLELKMEKDRSLVTPADLAAFRTLSDGTKLGR